MLKTPTVMRSSGYRAATVDIEQLKMFSVMMKTWWDPQGPMKGLHSLNELRVPFIIDGLKKNISDKDSHSKRNLKLLDVGCGGGILCEALARQGVNVTGIDASCELIDVAIQHSRNETIMPSYYCTTIEDHAIKNANLYDGVIASEVIEHINNQELFVKSCIQVLKPNGRLLHDAQQNKTIPVSGHLVC